MWNMEGLVVIGFCAQDYQKPRESMHIPFVVYDGYFTETEKICNLVIDNYDGGRQAGEYLRGLGHRNVLCIADNYSCMDKEKIEGFWDGFAAEDGCSVERQMEFMQIPFKREERSLFYTDQEAFGGLCSVGSLCGRTDAFSTEEGDACSGRYIDNRF